MKSGKTIDVSKSSLVSLKAELLRKQEEVQKSKTGESYIRPTPKPKKEPKKNPGVEGRSEKDVEITQEEVDALKKSREVLEIKARLYDKLQRGQLVAEDSENTYLVDFKEKLQSGNVLDPHPPVEEPCEVLPEPQDIPLPETSSVSVSASTPVPASVPTTTASLEPSLAELLESSPPCSVYSSDEDSDWVEYVDCLGRTRRCLKEDLPRIKARDNELSRRLGEHREENQPQAAAVEEKPPELVSSDMEREALRLKWEQQEQLLANKKNIYYEDVRFDEARSHGVAYYALSTDETRREEQQAELRRAREQTEALQREAAASRARRDLAKQGRLVAARQRQRQRLGLPPLEQAAEEPDPPAPEATAPEPPAPEEDLEAKLRRAAHVRPWDVGKHGQPNPVMSQEEWVEKKRGERDDEFAPPKAYEFSKGAKKRKQFGKKSWPVRGREEEQVGAREVGPTWPPRYAEPTARKEPEPASPPSRKEPGPASPPSREEPGPAWPPAREEPGPAWPPAREEPGPAWPPAREEPGPAWPPAREEPGPAWPPAREEPGPAWPPAREEPGPALSKEKQAPWRSARNKPPGGQQPRDDPDEPKRRRAEVAPPLSFSYYTPESRPTQQARAQDMMESIEAGLQFLREQSERREKLIGKK